MTGRIALRLFGQARTVLGGPFDDYRPPAVGVCLEAASVRAGEARILLPIPDFAPPGPDEFVEGLAAILVAARAVPDLPLYIGCRAGLGRTGTVMAGLAKVTGIDDPVGWVRAAYDRRAVETPAQELAVAALDVDAVWRAYAAKLAG